MTNIFCTCLIFMLAIPKICANFEVANRTNILDIFDMFYAAVQSSWLDECLQLVENETLIDYAKGNDISDNVIDKLFAVGPTDRLFLHDENYWIHKRLTCNELSTSVDYPKRKFCISHYSNGVSESQCLPENCSPSRSVILEVTKTLNDTQPHLIRRTECSLNKFSTNWYRNPSMVLAGIILFLQAVIAISATIYDFNFRDPEDPDDYLATHNIFTCWSLKKNFVKIFEFPQGKSQTIRPILGLRVISMFWFFVGRSQVLAMPFIENLEQFQKGITQPWYMQIFVNYTLSMDVFFLISGILTGYRFFVNQRAAQEEPHYDEDRNTFAKDMISLFKKLQRHRFLRLWPTMVWMFLIVFGIQSMFPNHPLLAIIDPWNQCTSTFWLNWMFLNTIFPTRCMRYTWYMSNDFIYHIISPLVLLGLFGGVIWGAMTVLVTTVPAVLTIFTISLIWKYPPSVFPFPESHSFPESFYNHETQILIRPFTHFGPFMIGLIFGYLISIPRSDDPFVILSEMQAPAHWKKFAWMGSIFGLIWTVFGTYPAVQGYDLQIYYVIYASFGRITFALSVAWLVYACYIDEAVNLNRFLGFSLWLPFSNLGYSMFIIHYFVINIQYYLIDFPIVWNGPQSLIPHILTQLGFTLLVSLPVYFFIALPPFSIEKICMDEKPPPGEKYQAHAEEERETYLDYGRYALDTVTSPLAYLDYLKRIILRSPKFASCVYIFCNFWGILFLVFLGVGLLTLFLNIF